MAREVVEDHEIAGPERRDQVLLDPRLEGALVDRPVEHARCAQPVPAQAGQGAPPSIGPASSAAKTPLHHIFNRNGIPLEIPSRTGTL